MMGLHWRTLATENLCDGQINRNLYTNFAVWLSFRAKGLHLSFQIATWLDLY